MFNHIIVQASKFILSVKKKTLCKHVEATQRNIGTIAFENTQTAPSIELIIYWKHLLRVAVSLELI